MRYLFQLAIILLFSLLGELLHAVIPLPIPASIYGFILLFLSLRFRIIRISAVKDVGKFLLDMMPVLFVPAAVGLLSSWELLRPILLPVFAITVITTVTVFFVSGKVSDGMISIQEKRRKKDE